LYSRTYFRLYIPLTVRLIYFVHNLNDPAVAKRVMMLKASGVNTFLVGFWREKRPKPEIGGAEVLALGQSFDGRLAHRAYLSLRNALFSRQLTKAIGSADLLMARNLEMLAIAASLGNTLCVPLIYEVLDIHRLLTVRYGAGAVLRAVERALMLRVSLLLVSSPAYLSTYFERFQSGKGRPASALIENKLLKLQGPSIGLKAPMLAAGPPWRIGWLGMLRCRQTLAILSGLAAKRPDLVRVEIYGRPSREVGEDLAKGLPASVTFGGAYQPSDLVRLYGGLHFNWAIDYFEQGLNSRWQLPNRIYEGGYHDVIPLALRGTETAEWLKKLGLGVLFDDPGKELESFLDRLTPQTYLALKITSEGAPRDAFAADQAECDRMGRLLKHAMTGPESRAMSLAPSVPR
jgi:succinoglycan biosynthesis protein ExoL